LGAKRILQGLFPYFNPNFRSRGFFARKSANIQPDHPDNALNIRRKEGGGVKWWILVASMISILLDWQVAPSWGKSESPKATPPAMKKYVSEQANFVLYIPEGWTVREGAQSGFRNLIVSDPKGLYQASLFYGLSPTGPDLVALARNIPTCIYRRS